MVAQRIEIGVVLDPGFGLVIGVREQAFQQIECWLDVAQEGVDTGGVILR